MDYDDDRRNGGDRETGEQQEEVNQSVATGFIAAKRGGTLLDTENATRKGWKVIQD